jgi:hypothetical protein
VESWHHDFAGSLNEMHSSDVEGSEVVKTVDTMAADVCLCDDGVVEVRIREGAVVEVREMEQILAAQLSLVDGPAVVLVDARPVRSMTREAQQITANTADDRDTRAVAILIGSAVSALLGNFFLELSRPVYPTKLFRNPTKARAWLLSHLEAALADGSE